jgi:hypothetical protein
VNPWIFLAFRQHLDLETACALARVLSTSHNRSEHPTAFLVIAANGPHAVLIMLVVGRRSTVHSTARSTGTAPVRVTTRQRYAFPLVPLINAYCEACCKCEIMFCMSNASLCRSVSPSTKLSIVLEFSAFLRHKRRTERTDGRSSVARSGKLDTLCGPASGPVESLNKLAT